MDCRDFRDKHALFVDQQCSALEEAELRQHMHSCPKCSRHDTVVRRGLMLVKSLPTIEPSPEFRARLESRLRSVGRVDMVPPTRRMMGAPQVAFFALAAGVAFVAYLATDMVRQSGPTEIRMTPVVASIPEFEPTTVASPALVVTVPTGMSVWPAIMAASQAPMHLVATEMATER
jgi:Putative zinc-finger